MFHDCWEEKSFNALGSVIPSLKLTFLPLKMVGFLIGISFSRGLFSGAMLVSGMGIYLTLGFFFVQKIPCVGDTLPETKLPSSL